jgi:hypothetical protein
MYACVCRYMYINTDILTHLMDDSSIVEDSNIDGDLVCSTEHVIRIQRDHSLKDHRTRFILLASHWNDLSSIPLPLETLEKIVSHINGLFEKAESVNRHSIFENLLAWLTGYLSYWFMDSYYDKVREE